MTWLRRTRFGRWAFWHIHEASDGTLIVLAPRRLKLTPENIGKLQRKLERFEAKT
jgi:hypothetical protein